MTLNEVMQIAIDSYPDGQIACYWKPGKNGKPDRIMKRAGGGDTLALFIALELGDTFDTYATSVEQLDQASRCLENAVEELQNVIHHYRVEANVLAKKESRELSAYLKESKCQKTQTA